MILLLLFCNQETHPHKLKSDALFWWISSETNKQSLTHNNKLVVIHVLQVEVKLSMKFTSREFSLKRMPSRKQSGVFGVKINVVTKWVFWGGLLF